MSGIDWEKVANESNDCFSDNEVFGLEEVVRQLMEQLGEHRHHAKTFPDTIEQTGPMLSQPDPTCDCEDRKVLEKYLNYSVWATNPACGEWHCPACKRRLP